MLCLACAMPGWPLCEDCVASLRRAPSVAVGQTHVDVGFRHVGAAVRLVHNLKYRRSVPAGRLLAAAMVQGLPTDATALVPIPRSFVRRVTYGVDQAVVLARELERATGLPVVNGLGAPLWWRRQAGADREHRHGVALKTIAAIPDRAVIVDDVVTTGATIASALSAIGRCELSALVATSAGTMDTGAKMLRGLGGDVTQMREATDYLPHAARTHQTTETHESGRVVFARPVRSTDREETG